MAVAVAQEVTGAFNTSAVAMTGVGATSTILLGATGSPAISGVSDNAGTHYTWAKLASIDNINSSGNYTDVWYGYGGGGGAFTVTLTGLSGGIICYELTGTNTSSPLDTQNSSNASPGTGSFTTVTMTPSTSGELVVFFVWANSGASGTPSSPWTVTNPLSGYLCAAWQAGVAQGTGYSTSWTQGGTYWSGIGAVFQPPAALPATSGPPPLTFSTPFVVS